MTTNVQKLSRKVTIAFADSPLLTGRELAQFNVRVWCTCVVRDGACSASKSPTPCRSILCSDLGRDWCALSCAHA